MYRENILWIFNIRQSTIAYRVLSAVPAFRGERKGKSGEIPVLSRSCERGACSIRHWVSGKAEQCDEPKSESLLRARFIARLTIDKKMDLFMAALPARAANLPYNIFCIHFRGLSPSGENHGFYF